MFHKHPLHTRDSQIRREELELTQEQHTALVLYELTVHWGSGAGREIKDHKLHRGWKILTKVLPKDGAQERVRWKRCRPIIKSKCIKARRDGSMKEYSRSSNLPMVHGSGI